MLEVFKTEDEDIGADSCYSLSYRLHNLFDSNVYLEREESQGSVFRNVYSLDNWNIDET